MRLSQELLVRFRRRGFRVSGVQASCLNLYLLQRHHSAQEKKNHDPNNSNQNICPPNVCIKLKQITPRYKLAIIIIVSSLLNEVRVNVIFLHIMLLMKLLRVIYYGFTIQSSTKQRNKQQTYL